MPRPVTVDAENQSASVQILGGTANFSSLEVHELRSAWIKGQTQ